jgi:hypothetical protein
MTDRREKVTSDSSFGTVNGDHFVHTIELEDISHVSNLATAKRKYWDVAEIVSVRGHRSNEVVYELSRNCLFNSLK